MNEEQIIIEFNEQILKDFANETGMTEEKIKELTYLVLAEGIKKEGIPALMQINVNFVSNEEIKEINKEYRQIDKVTDVLSFPTYEKEELKEILEQKKTVPTFLGDIVINLENLVKQALEYQNTIRRELAYLLTHSFYHLLGEDHIKEEDKKIMRVKEEELLGCLNITRE